MKKLLLVLILLSGIHFSKAQTFTLNPGNTDTVVAPYDELTIFDIYPVNISPGDIVFKWTKVSVNLPVGWDYSLCDYGNCYTGIPNSGTMDTVGAGLQGLLGLNIYPFSISGQGIVKIYVYDSNFPNNGDTVTWVVNSSPVSVNEFSKMSFSFYPNPASSEVTVISDEIPGGSNWNIYDLNGKLITGAILSDSKKIAIDVLPEGLYFLQIATENKNYSVKFIKK